MTFLVSKHCQSFFFGDTGNYADTMLCKSGDLRKVLGLSSLQPVEKEALFRYQCIERNGGLIRETYDSLPPDEKKSLQFAFQKYGYDINYKPSTNFRYYMYDPYSPENCPQPGTMY